MSIQEKEATKFIYNPYFQKGFSLLVWRDFLCHDAMDLVGLLRLDSCHSWRAVKGLEVLEQRVVVPVQEAHGVVHFVPCKVVHADVPLPLQVHLERNLWLETSCAN